MLKGLDPLLIGELLHCLRDMGHGDSIVIADANFPASSLGLPVIELPVVDVMRATRAITSLLPIDEYTETPLVGMQVVGEPKTRLPVHEEFEKIVSDRAGRNVPIELVERLAFYERARSAYCTVKTGDLRAYCDIIIVKGVIFGDNEG